MLVAASSAAFGVGFLFVFIAFLLLSTWLLLLQHMLVESEPAPDRAVAGPSQWASARMLLGLAAAASIATFFITTTLFFVIPRVGLAALPFRGKIGSLVTGFSDRVELGAYGQIQTDTSVAMRVHVTGDVPPETLPALRWRGIVFDEFDGRAWSVSHSQRTTLRRSVASDYRVGAFRGRGPLLTQEILPRAHRDRDRLRGAARAPARNPGARDHRRRHGDHHSAFPVRATALPRRVRARNAASALDPAAGPPARQRSGAWRATSSCPAWPRAFPTSRAR